MRRTAVRQSIFFLSLACFTAISSATTMYAKRTFELSSKARAEVERLACSNPHGVAMESAVGYVWPSGPRTARVSCQPHTASRGRPVFVTTECWLRERRWECEASTLNIRFDRPDLPPTTALDGVTPDQAVEIVEFMATLPTYDGRPLATEDVRAVWHLKRESPEQIMVYLDGLAYYIQQLCSADRCSFEIAGWALVDR